MISLQQATGSIRMTTLLVAIIIVSTTTTVVEALRPDLPYLRDQDLANLMNDDKKNNNKYQQKHGATGAQQQQQQQQQQQWMSLSEDTEFLLNTNLPSLPKPPPTRNLAEEYEGDGSGETTTGAWEEYDPYSNQPFVEGMSEYDEYQQAWRLLGFMVDCNYNTDDDGNSGSGSEDVTEDGCARYVLWAAYVDLDYEGGGIGEYQYWDRQSQSYNDTACYYAAEGSGSGDQNNNGDDAVAYDDAYVFDDAYVAAERSKSRCAKMDCHEPDTNWSVLGFFKHRNYDDWMEQLFKHEGMCVWTNEEYAFMKNARKAWPQGCVDSGSTVTAAGEEEGTTYSYNLYYNIKPLRNGRIDIGLYTDTQCLDDYSVTTEEMEDTIGNFFVDGDGSGSQDENYDFSGDSLSESMDRWHSAFDVWHTCHPCIAHDLENLDGTKYTDDGDDAYAYADDYWQNYYNNYYNNNNRHSRKKNRKLGGEYDAEGDIFECYDDAGYTNVNQCMKFSAKTVMKTATFRDLSLGRTQATLVEYPLSGFYDKAHRTSYTKDTMGNIATYLFLSTMSLCLLYAVWNLYIVAKAARLERRRKKRKKKGKGKDKRVSVDDHNTDSKSESLLVNSDPPPVVRKAKKEGRKGKGDDNDNNDSSNGSDNTQDKNNNQV